MSRRMIALDRSHVFVVRIFDDQKTKKTVRQVKNLYRIYQTFIQLQVCVTAL